VPPIICYHIQAFSPSPPLLLLLLAIANHHCRLPSWTTTVCYCQPTCVAAIVDCPPCHRVHRHHLPLPASLTTTICHRRSLPPLPQLLPAIDDQHYLPPPAIVDQHQMPLLLLTTNRNF